MKNARTITLSDTQREDLVWIKAYTGSGIEALRVKSEQRRKPKLNREQYEQAVRKAVSNHNGF